MRVTSKRIYFYFINNYLQIKCGENGNDWSKWVPYWTFSYNNTVHSATGYSPYELVFGKMGRIPSNLDVKEIDPIYNFDCYISELRYRLQIAWKDAKEELINNKHNYKLRYDNKCYVKTIKIGDQVLVLNNARKNKLDPYYSGPYIVKALDLPNIIIECKGKDKTIHVNNTKLL